MARGVQIRLEPKKPTNLPDIDLISARIEAPIGQPEPDRAIKKPRKI